MSIESVTPSNHLILCRPLLLLPSIFPSIRVFSSESALAEYARRTAQAVLRYGLPEETLLNVNVPDLPRSAIKGVRITSLGRRRFTNPVIEKVDPHGRKYYWIAGTRVAWGRRRNTDHSALRRGMVSITPIHLDLTHHEAIEHLRGWEALIDATRRSSPVKRVKRGS